MNVRYHDSWMVDPSTALSPEGPSLIAEALDAGAMVLISRALGEWLDGAEDVDLRLLLAPEDLDAYPRTLTELRSLGGALVRFDHREADLSPDHREVLGELIASEEPAAPVWADEWAYLQSNSWLVSKLRRPIEAFRDAGSAVLEFGRRTGMNLIHEVIPREHVPPSLTKAVIGRAAAKWIVVGGASVGSGTLAGVAGAALGGPVGTLLGGKAGAYVGSRATRAAVLAIDP